MLTSIIFPQHNVYTSTAFSFLNRINMPQGSCVLLTFTRETFSPACFHCLLQFCHLASRLSQTITYSLAGLSGGSTLVPVWEVVIRQSQ